MMYRNRLNQFFAGRNGQDALSKAVLILAAVLLFITMLTHQGIFYLLSMAALGYACFRMLSKDVPRRYQENQKFLAVYGKSRGKAERFLSWFSKESRQQRALYRIYRCPSCKQKVRVPRGRGKIEITCPKCRGTFQKRS